MPEVGDVLAGGGVWDGQSWRDPKSKNVLAVFAHPDDEVLGAGGTLAKHAENGDKVGIVILADRGMYPAVSNAAKTLTGSDCVFCRDFPDQALDTIPLTSLISVVEEYDWADVVYTHHPGDLNQDHALTAQAVLTAFRPKPGEKPRTILACEVLSSTEYTYPRVFQPNWYVELKGDQLNKKVDALRCYTTEVQPAPHPRSLYGVTNLAMCRGSEVGVHHAEAFQLLRHGPA